MAKKLSKYGNSFAIIIDKPILELLEISENTSLKLKTDGKNIIIEPIRKKGKHKSKKTYDEIVEEFGPALEKLAK